MKKYDEVDAECFMWTEALEMLFEDCSEMSLSGNLYVFSEDDKNWLIWRASKQIVAAIDTQRQGEGIPQEWLNLIRRTVYALDVWLMTRVGRLADWVYDIHLSKKG